MPVGKKYVYIAAEAIRDSNTWDYTYVPYILAVWDHEPSKEEIRIRTGTPDYCTPCIIKKELYT